MFSSELAYLFIKNISNIGPILKEFKDFPLMASSFTEPVQVTRPFITIDNPEDLMMLTRIDLEIQRLIKFFVSHLTRNPNMSPDQFSAYLTAHNTALRRFNNTSSIAQDAKSYILCLQILLNDYTEIKLNLQKFRKLHTLRVGAWALVTLTWTILQHLLMVTISIIHWTNANPSHAKMVLNHDFLKDRPWLLQILTGNFFSVTEATKGNTWFPGTPRTIDFNSGTAWFFTAEDWITGNITEKANDLFTKLIKYFVDTFLPEYASVDAIVIKALLQGAFSYHVLIYGSPFASQNIMAGLGKCLAVIRSLTVDRFVQYLFTRTIFLQTDLFKQYETILQNRLEPIDANQILYIENNPGPVFRPIMDQIAFEAGVSASPRASISSVSSVSSTNSMASNTSMMTADEFEDLDEKLDELYSGQLVVNPFTNRKIKIGFQTFNKLKLQGYKLHIGINNSLTLIRN